MGETSLDLVGSLVSTPRVVDHNLLSAFAVVSEYVSPGVDSGRGLPKVEVDLELDLHPTKLLEDSRPVEAGFADHFVSKDRRD